MALLVSALAVCALYSFWNIAYLASSTFHPMPWQDEWDTISLFQQMGETSHNAWRLFFLPHNEHRLAFPRLVYSIDFALARGTGALNLFAILVLHGGLAICLIRSLYRDRDTSSLTSALAAFSIICVLFSGHQMSNFLWGFQVQVTAIYFFVALAFWYLGEILDVDSKRSPWLSLGAVALFSVLAVLSMGNGIAILPIILFVIACHSRQNALQKLIVFGVFALAVIVWYVRPLLGRQTSGSFATVIQSPVEAVLFLLSFLGGPLANVASSFVIPFGAVIAGLSAIVLICYPFRRQPLRSETLSFGLVAFGVISALMVTVSRLRFGLEGAVESRYGTPVLVLYASLIVWFWHRLPWRYPTKLAAFSIYGLAAILAVYSVASHLHLPYDYSPLKKLKSAAEAAFVSGVRDDAVLHRVSAPLQKAWELRPFLMREGLSIFSSPLARMMNQRLSDLATIVEGQCLGHLDGVLYEVNGPNGGYAVHGWAFDMTKRAAPIGIALTDKDGLVRGIGRVTEARPDVIAAFSEINTQDTGFVGYVPSTAFPTTAYAVINGGANACPLPGHIHS
jgi:hypothetical protein